MTLDWDDKIRMDCSFPNAMASLRHHAARSTSTLLTVTTPMLTATESSPTMVAMNPNHYLAVAIYYPLHQSPRMEFETPDR